MTPSHEHWFDHEKLEVYREAIAFVAWLSTVLENAVRVGDVKDQTGSRLHVRAEVSLLEFGLGPEIKSKMKIKIRKRSRSKIQIKRKTIHDALPRALV